MVLFFKTILTKEFPYFLFFVIYVLLHNTNRRAIIAKSIRTYIKPTTPDKSPQIVKEEFLQYFMSHGWNIKHAWEKPKPYLQVENDDYIVTLDLVSQETNTWRMIIAYNNFFERNNL